eukprot:gene5583-7224_t
MELSNYYSHRKHAKPQIQKCKFLHPLNLYQFWHQHTHKGASFHIRTKKHTCTSTAIDRSEVGRQVRELIPDPLSASEPAAAECNNSCPHPRILCHSSLLQAFHPSTGYSSLLQAISSFYRLLQPSTGHFILLQAISSFYRLLQSSTGHFILLQATPAFYRPFHPSTGYSSLLQAIRNYQLTSYYSQLQLTCPCVLLPRTTSCAAFCHYTLS